MSFAEIANALAHHGGRLLSVPGVSVVPDGRSLEGPGENGIRELRVVSDDGVDLYVEINDCEGSDLTVVFCHGYLLNSTSWQVQRDLLDGRTRVVLWDHRGHGRSGWGTPPNATIDQVGRDLFAVIEAAAPRGRLVLVGHSMGGMSILGLAKTHPELFGGRVAGVVLSSTSAGGLSTVTAGLPPRTAKVMHYMLPVALQALRRQARIVDAARRSIGGLTYVVTWPYLYGSRVPKPVAKLTTQLMASVPVPVIAEFYKELVACDLQAGLPALKRVPVLVLVGERDLITPVEHAEALVAALPGAELAVIPDAGHLLILERPGEVAEHVAAMIARVPAMPAAASGGSPAVALPSCAGTGPPRGRKRPTPG